MRAVTIPHHHQKQILQKHLPPLKIKIPNKSKDKCEKEKPACQAKDKRKKEEEEEDVCALEEILKRDDDEESKCCVAPLWLSKFNSLY